MSRTLTRLVRALALACLALAAGAPLAAQGSQTTGAIRGVVTAADTRAPIVAAQVSAVNEETGLTRNALSDDEGVFVLRLLPPGSYRVSVRRIGYQPLERAGVRVIVGTTASASFEARTAAAQLAEVRVTAESERTDVTDAAVRTTVTQEEIEALPSLGRDFTDFINLSGLVSPTPEATTGGQFSIAGQRPSQTNIQIDGVDANNSFFGENRGGSRIPFAFSLESIREFQVITNGYDVEYGNYSGGLVNIVTKGGTNTFRGSVYGNFRGEQLTKNDFDGNPPNDYSVQQYAAQVEGPFIADKLHYLFSLDGQRRREPFQSITPDYFRTLSTPQPALADSMERYYEILENVYGIENPGATYGQWEITNDVLTLFGRIDWTINDKHRLSVRNNFSTYENVDEAGSFAFRTGRSQAETIEDRTNSFVTELTSVLGSNMFNTFRLQYATEARPRTPNSYLPELSVRLTPSESPLEFGGAFISFDNDLEEKKLQLVNNFTITVGDHALKLGTNNTFSSFVNRFWLNGSGAYEFRSLADFENRMPTRYTRFVRPDRTAPTAEFDAQEYSVYAQDDWQVTPKLLASIGLRYDVARYGDAPRRVIDVERAYGLETGVAPVDDDNISPRVALTYDIHGDARAVIRAGAGLFYGRVPYVMGSNVQITDVPLLSLTCQGSIAEGAPDAPPIPDFPSWDPTGRDNPFDCAGGSGVGGVPEYSFWNDGFEIPQTFKASLGYERLLFGATRLKMDILWSESSKLYTVRNLNLRDPQFTLESEGGRRVFVPASRFNPTTGAGAERLRNTDFGNIYVNHNDGVARSLAASLELQHRLSEDLSVTGSYTFTRAHDNSSFSCCTSNAGFTSGRYGVYGPNVIGEVGDEDAGWGPSDFVRNHTVILSGFARLPYGFQLSAFWRMQSGTPWTPEQSGDLNGDGERFNDRPYIFRPAELPVAVPTNVTDPIARDSVVADHRVRYARYLADNECIGDYVGRIIPRNTCRNPWFNRLDLSVRKRFEVADGRGAELSVDLFNVLNGLNSDWGRYRAVTSANRNLLNPVGFNAESGEIEYAVPTTLGEERQLGSNLLLQFSAQVGARIFF